MTLSFGVSDSDPNAITECDQIFDTIVLYPNAKPQPKCDAVCCSNAVSDGTPVVIPYELCFPAT